MTAMIMLEDVERIIEKIGDQDNIMEFYYMRGVLRDWKYTFGQVDLRRDVAVSYYGSTLSKILAVWR